jgi:hypothetical protein
VPSLMQTLLQAELAQLQSDTMKALFRQATSGPFVLHTIPWRLVLWPPWHSQRYPGTVL